MEKIYKTTSKFPIHRIRKENHPKRKKWSLDLWPTTALFCTEPNQQRSSPSLLLPNPPVHLSDLSGAGKLCQLGYPVFKHTETDAPPQLGIAQNWSTHSTTNLVVPHLGVSEDLGSKKCFAANSTFARFGSRISFDMLKSLRRASVFLLSKT